jgi:hypothetical protein
MDYYFNYAKINNLLVLFLLSSKIIIDLLSFIKKENKIIIKVSYSYIFLIILLWVFFIPNVKNEAKLLNKNLNVMLELNSKVFFKFNLNKNKLPDDEFFNQISKLDLGESVYLKKGDKKYKYKIKILYSDYPIQQPDKFPPGTFFIVVSKKYNDFYITASVIDPFSKKISMLALNGEIIVLNKNINIEDLHNTKNKMELTRQMFINLKDK